MMQYAIILMGDNMADEWDAIFDTIEAARAAWNQKYINGLLLDPYYKNVTYAKIITFDSTSLNEDDNYKFVESLPLASSLPTDTRSNKRKRYM